MRRLLVPTCLLLAGALLVPALLSVACGGEPQALARSAGRAAPLGEARACKPQPPVATSLVQTASDGDVVELAFAVTPHADAGALQWSLELPPGAALLSGPSHGALPAGAAGTGPLVARVRLPAGSSRVVLDVDSELAPSAGRLAATRREPVRARTALTWGAPPRADGRTLVDAADDERIARVPVRHREGR